jgi:hypothetical protein
MWSFEAAAIAGCILAEDTTEHREIIGADNDAVRNLWDNCRDGAAGKKIVADADDAVVSQFICARDWDCATTPMPIG